MKIETIEDLLIADLSSLQDAEKQLIEALPMMAEQASAPELKEALQQHLEQTREQLNRLEQCFEILASKSENIKSEGMSGIIADGKSLMEMITDPEVKDVALVAAATKVEHFEIACYTGAVTLAQGLENEEVEELLTQNLDEEEEARAIMEGFLLDAGEEEEDEK